MSPSEPIPPQPKALVPHVSAGSDPGLTTPAKRMITAHRGSGGDEGHEALAETFSPLALLQALQRRPMQAAAAGLLLAALAGGLVWFLRPPKFTASAFLRVSGVEQKILENANGRPDLELTGQYQKTQVALLKSRRVIRGALKEDKVRHLPLISQQREASEWLEKELVVEFIPNTEILRVSLSSREHTDDLAVIVNAIQQSYMTLIVEGERIQQRAILGDMERIYEASQEKLREQREKLRELSNTVKTGDSQILTIKQKNLLEEYASMRKELLGLQSRLRESQVKLAAQTVKPAKEDPALDTTGQADAALDLAVDADPLVQRQQAEVTRLEGELVQIDSVATKPDSPVRRDRKRQLDTAQAVLNKVRTEKRLALAARARQGRQAERLVRSQEMEAEMKALKKVHDALTAEVAGLGREVDSMGTSSIQLELKRNEIEQSEVVLKSLRQQKERLQVELESKFKSRVVLDDPADGAEVLSKKARLVETLAASFGGLFLGLFGVSFREFQARKLYTPADVRRRLGLRVMGTLPELPAGRLADRTGHQVLLDSVDSLRTMLLQGCPEGGSSVLMISSAWSGEGKTTLATHLAGSLARAGRRTLLVDCDLRCPALHQLFNLPATPGVCDLLTGATIDETVQPSAVEGLSVLAAGDYSPTAGSALARGAMQEVFARLRCHFDFIIVDSSPLLAMADTLMVGKGVDGVVLSVRAGVSQAPHVHAAYECLRQLGLPFVGTVVNGIHDRKLYAHNSRYAALRTGN